MDKEMELLLAEQEIKVGDKSITVKRIALLDTLRLTKMLSDIAARIINSSDKFDMALYKVFYDRTEDDEGKPMDNTAIRVSGILEVIGMAGDDAVDFIKSLILKSTTISEEDVENITAEDGIDIIEKIYQVNKGFFVKCSNKLKERIKPEKKKK